MNVKFLVKKIHFVEKKQQLNVFLKKNRAYARFLFVNLLTISHSVGKHS